MIHDLFPDHGGAVDEGRLVLAFDGDPEFARGFEAGVQWGMMGLADRVSRETEAAGVPVVVDEFSELMHPDNAEMIMRMAEARGWTAISEDVEPDLLRVTFARRTR